MSGDGNTLPNEARVDQACSGDLGVLSATIGSLVMEAGGFTTDGGTSEILGDAYLDIFTATGFVPEPVFVPSPLSGPLTRAKAAPMAAINQGTASPTDAILITGGMTCDIQDADPTPPVFRLSPTAALAGSAPTSPTTSPPTASAPI